MEDTPTNQQYPIYAITIPSRSDRNETLREHLDQRNLQANFVEGIMFKDLTNKSPSILDRDGKNIDAFRACAMSHRKALQTMLDNDDEYAIIIEDDARFHIDFFEKLDEFFAKYPDTKTKNGLILLSPFISSNDGIGGQPPYVVAKDVWSACGYFLSREKCQECIERIDRAQLDSLIDKAVSTESLITHGQNHVFIYPPLIIESTENPSSLWSGSEIYHQRYWKKFDTSNYL